MEAEVSFTHANLAGLIFDGKASRAAMICIVGALAALSLTMPAAAQDGSTCGLVETQDGPKFLGPCPNQRSYAPVMTGTWYAAIAKSSSSPFWGASWREKSLADAQRSALSRCNKGAHADCKVVVQGVNNCISLAESIPDGLWGAAYSELGREDAVSQATSNCRKYGGRACRVVITPCGRSLPNVPQCIPVYHDNHDAMKRGAWWASQSAEQKQVWEHAWNTPGNGDCN